MKSRISALILLFLIIAFSVSAQTDRKETSRDRSDRGQRREYITKIDTIMVTADKKAEKAREVPVAIYTLSGYEKESKGIEDLTDISSIAPGFHMPDYGTNLTSPIYIRGIGTRINEPAVGLYVDEIPYFDKATFNFNLFDISRIEILRGPQGTLYGRNSLGGLIKIHTRESRPESVTEIRLGYGSYDRRNIFLKQHIPVDREKLRISLAADYGYEDGYYDNVFSGQTIGGENNLAGRMKLDYFISEDSDLHLILEGSRAENDGYPYSMTENGDSLFDISYDHESGYDRDLATAGLVANRRWNRIRIKSVSAFQLVDDRQDIDQDFTSQDLFRVLQERRNRFYIHEFNISDNDPEGLNYVGGIFGYLQDRDKQVDMHYGQDAVSKYNLPGEMTKFKSYDKSIAGGAVFGQLSYRGLLADGVKLSAGLRYEAERTTLDYWYDREMMGSRSLEDEFEETMNDQVLLPKFSLSYFWREDMVQYATVTRGYKSGGFNSTIERDIDRTFGPEFSTNYELGFKGDLLGRSMVVGAALYYTEWEDQQVYQPVPSGQGAMLKNAGESHSLGGELEARVRPSAGLEFFLNYAYTEAKFDRYQRDPQTDYSGNYIPYIPRMTVNVGSDYRYGFNSGPLSEMRLHCFYQGIGKHFWNEANTIQEQYYGIFNMRVTAAAKDFDVSLWGKNIFGKDYNTFLFEFSPLQAAFAQRSLPARFGLTFTARFN